MLPKDSSHECEAWEKDALELLKLVLAQLCISIILLLKYRRHSCNMSMLSEIKIVALD